MNVSKRFAIALAIVSIALASEARAVDRFWIDTGGGLNSWNDKENWNPNDDYVQAGDNAFFDQDAIYTVILQAPSTAGNVTFSDGSVTLGGGTLNIGAATTIDDPSAAGLGDGARVTVSGPGWDNVGDAIVGDLGFGTLTIDTGSDFRSQDFFIGDDLGAEGEVTVDGEGTTLTTDGTEGTNGYFIGNAGTGTLNITGGGLAQILNDTSGSVADVRLGVTPDGDGTLNITGDGSSFIAEDVFIGVAGSGQLNITGGGVFNQNIYTSPDAVIAVDTASTGDVIVHGDGSEWSMAILTVGSQGDATLSIEAGGLVRSNGSYVVLGNVAGSGQVAVFGSGTGNSTLSVANALYVGDIGLGVLHVGQDLTGASDGAGALSVGSNLFIGARAGNDLDNRFVIEGVEATANIGGDLQTGVYGTGNFEALGGATVTVGGTVWAGVNSDASGTILVDGVGTTLDANVLIAGNGVGNGSTGAVTVSGGAVATLTGADSTSVAAVTLGDDGLGEGTLTVTGAGSIVQTTHPAGGWFIGGSGGETGGTGTVNILDGGQGISAFRVVIGYGTGADGTLNVDGTDSLFDASDTYVLVGYNGLGRAEVTNGGRLNANAVYVADQTSAVDSQLRINGADSTVDIDGFLRVGERSRGTVEVSGGAQLNVASGGGTDVLYIGTNGTADGSQLTVTGPGSRVDYFGTALVAVGVSGGSIAEPARLVVSDGGVFSAPAPISIGYATGSYGQIEISGEDSRVEAETIRVGNGNLGSSGILELANGGTATTTGELYVASAGPGNVAVDVSGPTSSLNVGTGLFLGWGTGVANLAVGQGGAVTSGGQAYIGWTNGSQATATVGSVAEDTSTWTIGGELTLAGTETTAMTSGFGRLFVNPGGVVDVASNLRIRNLGYAYLYGGELRVGGDLLFPDTGSLFYFNSGTLRFTDPTGMTLDAALLGRIFDGGPQTLTSEKTLVVDGTAQLTGELRLNGGTFRAGNISTDDFANVDFDAGTFELTDSNLVVDVGGLFGASLVLDGDETVNVVGHDTTIATDSSLNVIGGGFTTASAINDGLVLVSQTDAVAFDSDDSGTGLTNNGQLVLIDSTVGGPVTGSGAIEIVGAAGVGGLTLASGASLGIDIWGTGVGEFDRLMVAGAASLAGELMVDLAAGYTPAVGDTFEVLTAASLVDNGMLLTGDATGFSLVSTSTSLLLAFLPGDYNNDGTVNMADYTVWRDTLGATGVGLPADGDGSGTVDAIDYGIWKTNFGISAGAVFAALEYAAVPEPPALLLGCVAMLAIAGLSNGRCLMRWRSGVQTDGAPIAPGKNGNSID